jgi:hypothetical protein
MIGNSGGGVATLYAAACDTRIAVAVPSCSFCSLVGQNGVIYHCDCNTVPGILRWGEFHDVAGSIAPRYLLIVNGRQDSLFPVDQVDRAVEGVRRIYAACGVPERFVHCYGDGGHRFYADLMWPFIKNTILMTTTLKERSRRAAPGRPRTGTRSRSVFSGPPFVRR